MMLTTRAGERLAGGLLVASFLAFLGHVVTLIILGAGPVTIFLVFVYGLLIVLSAGAIYLVFGPHDRALAILGAMGFAAHGMFIVIVCAMILAQFEFALQFPEADGAQNQSVEAAGRALELAMDKIRTSSFIFMGLGLLPLGALIARSGAVARWVGWLALVGGVLGFFGLLAALFDVVADGLSSILIWSTFLTAFGFLLILGVRLFVWATGAPLERG